MGGIAVLIVDDHPIVRQGIRSALARAAEIEVVGEADNSSSALRQLNEHKPDIVLLDMQMPGSSGGAVVRRLKEAQPGVKVVVLTTFEDDEYLFGALEAGAEAYILKSIPLEELPSTLRSVQTGERMLSSRLTGKLMSRFQGISASPKEKVNISDFERQLLKLMAAGAKNGEIAELLFISRSTVKRRIQELCQKLDVPDRVQAIVEGINRGLI